jgi:2-aminobenzoate-CoA ligase
MTLLPSAHVDTFARDHLPAADLWPTLEFTLDSLQYPAMLNAAAELIDVPTARFGPDRIALRTPDGENWTYGELLERANQIAHVLTEEFGLVPGNRVLLRGPNTPLIVTCWLATLKAGLVAVTTFAALRARELAPIIEKTEPTLALVDHRALADVETLRREQFPRLTIVPFGGSGADDLTALIAGKPGRFENVATSADDVALFCPTSGSTGVPKITMHFHRDILSIDNTFGQHLLCLTPDDLVSCSAPLAFTFGLGMLVVFTLRAGASALLTDQMTPPNLADAVAATGVTVLATAPTAYRQIVAANKIDRLAGLRVAISAGEHLRESTRDRLQAELGIDIVDGIGSTEMLHIFISAIGDDIRPGTTGRVVPGFRATILDADGNELPRGEAGRLAVIGPIGCRYLNDHRQRDYVSDGWNITGDTFLQDDDGYFWFQARTDNMIISSGYNIGGPEVESAIDEHPDVLESAVVARPDDERGSVVCAFVVLRPDLEGNAAKAIEIQNHVKMTLAPYKYPRDVRFIEQLPRNTSGKTQHYLLRQQLIVDAAAEVER